MRGEIKYRRKYNAETCESVEVKVYLLDGQEVTQERFEEAFPEQAIVAGEPPGGPALTGWPIHSEALAYHPKQIPEARKYLESRGLGDTQIDSMGRPVLRDRMHRRRFMKGLGKHDNKSFYGY